MIIRKILYTIIYLFVLILSSHIVLDALKYKTVTSKAGSHDLVDDPITFYGMVGFYTFGIILACVLIYRQWFDKSD